MAYTAIDDPEAYFQTKLYTGNADQQAITLDGDTDMQPDLVWIKTRAKTYDHIINDSVRGVNNTLRPSTTGAESAYTHFSAFGSDGFTLENHNNVNESGDAYVAWCWKESATAGFDIVGYTGNGTDDTDISHSLSAVPHVILVKNRDAADPWRMQHKALGETYGLILNDTSAKDDDDTAWSDEAPTSSVFTLGTSVNTNRNTSNFIAYLFSEKQGFSKFGSYLGNGNADGPFVYTGFKPAFVMIKSITVASWRIWDNKREDYTGNPNQTTLNANEGGAEYDDASVIMDFLSNGFKIRVTGDNDAAEVITYMAFAEAPFVNSNGVPCNAR